MGLPGDLVHIDTIILILIPLQAEHPLVWGSALLPSKLCLELEVGQMVQVDTHGHVLASLQSSLE